jgi:hypothetical protein
MTYDFQAMLDSNPILQQCNQVSKSLDNDATLYERLHNQLLAARASLTIFSEGLGVE